MQNRRTPSSDHRRHDRLLIARFAADDTFPTELEEARTLIAGCAECAALADEIRSLSSAVAGLPTPRRPRDFRLTSEQAERLRGSWFERLMRRLATPGWAALRPVAGVAMSIGLVLAVVGAMPAALPAGAAPDQAQTLDSQAPAVAPEDTPRPPDQEGAPPATMGEFGPTGPDSLPTTAGEPGRNSGDEPEIDSAGATPEPGNKALDQAYLEAEPDVITDAGDGSAVTSGGNLMIYAGVLIAVAGLGVLLLAWFARRRYGDPLLR